MPNLKYALLFALAVSATAAFAGDVPGRITGATPLRLDGIGAIRIGMRLRQAIKASGMKFTDPKAYQATDDVRSCTYVSFADGPPDVSFMLLSGVIVRIDVLEKATNRTPEGAGIGTPETDIRKLFRGARIEVAPSHYEGGDHGHELTVTVPHHPGLRYFFATNLKNVVGMRIGRKAAVEYVEGCL